MITRQVSIIGVPLDLGAGHRGVDMGPSAIRVTGLKRRIETLGHAVTDRGNIKTTVADSAEVGDPRLRFVEPVLTINRALCDAVHDVFSAGRFPLVIGGDHSLAIGSIAGAATHFATSPETLGLIWIDAHADMNTPDTTPSGNIHGMSLAVALGHGDPRLTNLGTPGRKVRPEHVALIAARDLDPPERDALCGEGLTVFTMRDIDELGMCVVMQRAIDVVTRGTAGVYVQLDMDAVDPRWAPGTGTPVPGGLDYREAHLVMEMLADTDAVVGLDVVETNPALDIRNQTGQLATELILSLLGKRIFRKPSTEWAANAAPSPPTVREGTRSDAFEPAP